MHDGHEDCKSETHYINMHMDEQDTKKIVERGNEASICEVEQEHRHAQEFHCNMDGEADDDIFVLEIEKFMFENGNKSLSYEVMVCRVERASLVNSTTSDEFGEVEIANEHMHVGYHSTK